MIRIQVSVHEKQLTHQDSAKYPGVVPDRTGASSSHVKHIFAQIRALSFNDFRL